MIQIPSLGCLLLALILEIIGNTYLTPETKDYDLDEDDLIRLNDCYSGLVPYGKFASLFANLSFAFFIESCLRAKHDGHMPATSSSWKWYCVFYSLLEICYVLATTRPFYICQRYSYLFLREFFDQMVNYLLNIVVVATARYEYHHHLHLETLYLFTLVLFCEFCQIQFQNHGHFHAFAVYLYFNLKLGLVIFECYYDQPWTMVFKNYDYRNMILWLFYIGGKLTKQFYYTTPEEIRYDFKYKLGYDLMFGIGCVSEASCLFIMFIFQYRYYGRTYRLPEISRSSNDHDDASDHPLVNNHEDDRYRSYGSRS